MRMFSKLWTITALALVIGSFRCDAFAQGTLKCRPGDSRTANLISDITRHLTATDARTIYNRDSVMHLPVVSPGQVALVNDERVCLKVVQAYNGLPNPYTPASLYVIKLGSKGYVAYDPDRRAGEFSFYFIFNTKYARIGGWGGG